MISMVEKVSRLELEECYEIKDMLVQELRFNYDDFMDCSEIQEFEKEYMERYIK